MTRSICLALVICSVIARVDGQLDDSSEKLSKPSVYWISSPTLAGETLLIAGGIQQGSNHVTAKLCTTSDCSKPTPVVASLKAWKQSVKLTMPEACGPPCYLQLTLGQDSSSTVLAINAPDVWWALSGSPAKASLSKAALSREELSDLPLNVVLHPGEMMRTFGRSLGWSEDNKACLSAAGAPTAGAKTELFLSGIASGHPISAVAANCYEAAFPTASAQPGNYPNAVLRTAWGVSQAMNVTILAPAPPPSKIHMLDVLHTFHGDLPAAIDAAQKIVASNADDRCEIVLGMHTYTLLKTLELPERTHLVGSGASATALQFDLMPPMPSDQKCSKPILADFFTNDCKARGCHIKPCPGCFLELEVVSYAGSPEGCCAACIRNSLCNAWTFIGSVKPSGYCTLNSCPDEPSDGHNASCASTPSSPGPNNRTSGWILNRAENPIPPSGILAVGAGNQVLNLSITLKSAQPHTPAIWVRENATGFVARGLNITMLQVNVSNAFKIESVGFEVTENTMHQTGGCLYPNYGPKSDSTSFQPSATIYAHNARAGRLAANTVYWRCSAYDLDVSDRVIFEDNRIICTEQGVVPHGNSISGYDWRTHPSSRWWSIARNHLTRPPYHKGTEQNWVQRETMTTDGSGAFGSALVQSLDTLRTTIKLRWLVWSSTPVPGTTFVVLSGPGVGQSRRVVSTPENGTVILDKPLDEWITFAGADSPSVVAVTSSFGSKLIVGNVFNWTEVVQWYGNTLRGVAADNSFTDANVKEGGNINRGSLGGVGECYHGSDPLFFTEYRGNHMVRSDGISLRDTYNTAESQCAKYGGPWVRWAVIRGNEFAGISKAALNNTKPGQKPNCGAVTVFGTASRVGPSDSTSDVVVERNRFSCPPEGNQTSTGDFLMSCTHCVAGDSGGGGGGGAL